MAQSPEPRRMASPSENVPEGFVLLDPDERLLHADRIWSPFAAKWRRPHDHEVDQPVRNFYAAARLAATGASDFSGAGDFTSQDQ